VNRAYVALLALIPTVFGAIPAHAEDWPMIQKDPAHTGSVSVGPETPLRLAWKASPQDSETNFTTWPVVYGGMVYASSGPGILAVEATTGRKKWFISPEEGQNIVAPAVDENGVYIPVGENQLLALDRMTGAEIWRFGASGELRSSPTVSDGRIYFSSAEGNTFYCVDAKTGKLVWESVQDLEPFNVPVVSNGLVVFSTRDLSSTRAFLVALDVVSGRESWRVSQDGSSSSPAILGDKVIVGTRDTAVKAYELSSGRPIWSSPISNLIAAESSPAIAFGDVFVADRTGNFYRFEGATGRQKWHLSADEGTFNQSFPVIAGTTMFIGGGAGWIHGIDIDSGKELWREQVGGYIHSGATDGERFYFGVKFQNEGIYAYEHDPNGRKAEAESDGTEPWLWVAVGLGLAAVLLPALVFMGRRSRGGPVS
jgi:outer membrane protein assembly factor BamB